MDASEHDALCANFFDNINISKDSVVAAYWPIERELDTHFIIDEILDRGAKLALPVIDKDTRILKFAQYTHSSELVSGAFGVCHPIVNEQTQWLSPEIFIVPMLAFDRRGARLGFGGGYYDATLAHYKKDKDIIAVGLAYAEQACLFNLPTEDHDIKMDWVITQQSAHNYKGNI